MTGLTHAGMPSRMWTRLGRVGTRPSRHWRRRSSPGCCGRGSLCFRVSEAFSMDSDLGSIIDELAAAKPAGEPLGKTNAFVIERLKIATANLAMAAALGEN